ncbi:MAG: hypothetical protein GSR77_08215 [Desulfurococcales archaeon]|nr:hypothetical protein [Desulfurococcales archaeon]
MVSGEDGYNSVLIYSSIVGVLERIGVALLLLLMFEHGFSCLWGCFWLGIVFGLSEALSRLLEVGVEDSIGARKASVVLARLRLLVSSSVFVFGLVGLLLFLLGLGILLYANASVGFLILGVSMVFLLPARSLIGWVLARSGLYRLVLGSSVLGVTVGFFMAVFGSPGLISVVLVLSGVYVSSFLMLLVGGWLAGLVSRRYFKKDVRLGSCDVPCLVSSAKYVVVGIGVLLGLSPVALLGLFVLFDGVQRIVLVLFPRFGLLGSVLHVVSVGTGLAIGVEYGFIVLGLSFLSLFGLGSQSPLRVLLSV